MLEEEQEQEEDKEEEEKEQNNEKLMVEIHFCIHLIIIQMPKLIIPVNL